MEVGVADSSACTGCSVALSNPDVSCSGITLTRKVLPFVKVWNPSDGGESRLFNRYSHGALTKMFLKPSLPFSMGFSVTVGNPAFVLPTTSGGIQLMSVYHPFPLRIDGVQPEACFQIGEFNTTGWIPGSGVVVLIPLAASASASGAGMSFINAFAGKMTGVVAAHDAAVGYNDMDVTLTDWKIGNILRADRPFFTWMNKDGTRVVVMSEAVEISSADMASITKSIPQTPPTDAIHEINPAKYRARPVDCAAHPERCAKPITVVQPPVPETLGAEKKELIIGILRGVGYTIVLFFFIWLGIRFAKGSGSDFMTWLGKQLAGAMGGARTAITTGAAGVGSAARAVGQGASAATGAVTRGATTAARGVRSGISTLAGTSSRTQTPTNVKESAKQAAIKRGKPSDTFMTTNPMLNRPRPSPAEQAAAAGVGLLKEPKPPSPVIPSSPPPALKPKKEFASTSPETPMQKAIAAKKAKNAAIIDAAKLRAKNPGQQKKIEETSEERIARRARETALPSFTPSLQTKYLRNTGAVAGGGKRKRKNRMKTGRKV